MPAPPAPAAPTLSAAWSTADIGLQADYGIDADATGQIVLVAWSVDASATTILIRRSKDQQNWTQIYSAAAPPDSGTYADGSVAIGTTYFYQVAAENGSGTTWGPSGEITTAIPAPAIALSGTVVDSSGRTATLGEGIALHGSVVAVSGKTGSLWSGISLKSTAAAASTVTLARLSVADGLKGPAVAANSVASGRLSQSIGLRGACAAAAAMRPALSQAMALHGLASVTTSSSGRVFLQVGLIGAAHAFSGPNLSATMLADGPVSYYRMNDPGGSSTAQDATGRGETGTLHGGVTAGEPGPMTGDPTSGSMYFDGSTGYISIPVAVGVNPPAASLEALIFMLPGSGDGIVGFHSHLDVIANPTSVRLEAVQTGGGSGSFTVPDLRNGWHLLLMTYEGNTLVGFLDGAQFGTVTLPSQPTLSLGSGAIGQWDSYFKGYIAEQANFTYALTAAQAANHQVQRGATLSVTIGLYGVVVATSAPTARLSQNVGLVGTVAATSSKAAAVASAIKALAPLGYWEGNDLSGPIVDSSGSGLNGTLSGSGVTLGQPGILGAGDVGMLLDGAHGYVQLPAGTDVQGPFTIIAWVQPTSFGSSEGVWVVAADPGPRLNINPLGQVRGDVQINGSWQGYATNTGPILLNAPALLAYQVSGTTQKLWVNGVLCFSGAIASGTISYNAADPLVIGADNYASSPYHEFFKGLVEHVALIHGSTPTDAQVASVWNAGATLLAVTMPLQGTVGVHSTVVGALGQRSGLAGTVAARGTIAAAALRQGVGLHQTVSATAAAHATMSQSMHLVGVCPAHATLAGAMRQSEPMASSTAAHSGYRARLSQSMALADAMLLADAGHLADGPLKADAPAFSYSVVTGFLQVLIEMSGAAVATSAATGRLQQAISLGGTIAAHTGSTARLADAVGLQATAVSSSTLSATMSQKIGLVGAIRVVAGPNYRATVLADRPIGFYRPGTVSGTTVYDESGYGHNGTIDNLSGVSFGWPSPIISDPGSTSIEFGGALGDLIWLNGTWQGGLTEATFEVWINAAAASNYSYVMMMRWYFYLVISTATALRLNGMTWSGLPNLLNSWHHAVVGWGLTEGELILDGTSYGLKSQTQAPFTLGAGSIGADPGGGDNFTGYEAEVAIYPYKLTASQAQSHYRTSQIAGAVLSVAMSLQGSTAAISGSSGRLQQAVGLTGTVAAAGAVTAAPLKQAIGLVGTAAARATPQGGMRQSQGLAGTIAGMSGRVVRLSQSMALHATVAATVIVRPGALDQAIGLKGTVAASVFASGSAGQMIRMSGAIHAAATPSGAVSQSMPLHGSVATRSAVTGALGQASWLKGSVSAAGTVSSAALRQAIGLVGRVSCVSGPSYRLTVLADGPNAYWRGDATSGATATDVTGNGHAGTLHGDAAVVQPGLLPGDPAGGAFDFSGAGYVLAPYSAAMNPQQFSIECLAEPDAYSGTYFCPIGSRGNNAAGSAGGYNLYAASDGKWQFWVGNGGWQLVDSGIIATAGLRRHLVGTYDGSTMRIYVDGVFAGSLATTFTPNVVNGLSIGANDGGTSWFMKGKVAEPAMYPRVLTAAQIQAHSNVSQIIGATLSVAIGLEGAATARAVAGAAASQAIYLATVAAADLADIGRPADAGVQADSPGGAYSTLTGALTVTLLIEGACRSVSSLTAAMRQTMPLRGAAPARAAVAATLAQGMSLHGSVVASAGVTGSLKQAEGLAGNVTALSTIGARLSQSIGLRGTAAAASALQADMHQAIPLHGACAASAGATGRIQQSVGLHGEAHAASTVAAAALAQTIKLFGSAQAFSAFTGSTVQTTWMRGDVAAISAVTPTLSQAMSLRATGAAHTVLAASLKQAQGAAGSVAAYSGTTAVLSQSVGLNGVSAAQAVCQATAAVSVGLTGSVHVVSGAGADMSQSMPLHGQVSAFSGIRAPLGYLAALHGAVVVASSVRGVPGEAIGLGFRVAATAAVTGTLSVADALRTSGVHASSGATASLSQLMALRGSIYAESRAAASLLSEVGLAGVISGHSSLPPADLDGAISLHGSAAATAALQATLAQGMSLHGGLMSVSAFVGVLGQHTGLYGVMQAQTLATANLGQHMALEGVVPVHASAMATLGQRMGLRGALAATSAIEPALRLWIQMYASVVADSATMARLSQAMALFGETGGASHAGAALAVQMGLSGAITVITSEYSAVLRLRLMTGNLAALSDLAALPAKLAGLVGDVAVATILQAVAEQWMGLVGSAAAYAGSVPFLEVTAHLTFTLTVTAGVATGLVATGALALKAPLVDVLTPRAPARAAVAVPLLGRASITQPAGGRISLSGVVGSRSALDQPIAAAPTEAAVVEARSGIDATLLGDDAISVPAGSKTPSG